MGTLVNYIAAMLMVLYGLYILTSENNLIRKVIGMVILQTGVILFYISISVKKGAQIPIIPEALRHGTLDPSHFANPLPHALMLTAIVVGVSTLGVALVLIVSIYRTYQTVEEDDILAQLESENDES